MSYNPGKVVIGLGFGDEGKGLVTEYLASKSHNPIVVRYSGGQQAGHTVYKNDKKHIFSNFGAGSLSGIATHWSKFCTVDPIGLTNELKKLLSMGVEPKIYIHPDSPVTTPFDMLNNQSSIDNLEHGSCGLGVGSTFQREEDFYSLTFSDLFYPSVLLAKLNSIGKYYGHNRQPKIERFLECVDLVKSSKHINTSNESELFGKTLILEGSQGLLLDQHFGFFPNVTRSNIGSKNIYEITPNMVHSNSYYLVTRAYQTRHGNGFMTNESIPHNIKKNPEETNTNNKYQGEFRRSILDLDLIEYGLNKDKTLKTNLNKFLVVTCLDHVENQWKFTYKGNLRECSSKKHFLFEISNILQITRVLYSESPYSKNIKELEK
jgi:adenylosuccinate synthase